MGITKTTLPILMDYLQKHKRRDGKVLILGNQEIFFDKKYLFEVLSNLGKDVDTNETLQDVILNEESRISSTDFFKLFGFNDIHILDVSDYEKADILFDLNDRALPQELRGQFDFIFDIGTLEHVFDIKTAMDNLSLMCSATGHIFHNVPFRIEHGYHSISPSFFIDYYRNNQWEVDTIRLAFSHNEHYYYSPDIRFYHTRHKVFTYVQEMITQGYTLGMYCCATRSEASHCDLIPQQSFYEKLYSEQEGRLKYCPGGVDVLIDNTVNYMAGLKKGSTILYGTGDAFHRIINGCIKKGTGRCVKAIADRDENLLGRYVRNYEVVSLEQINRDYDIERVIIASYNQNADIIHKRISKCLREDIHVIRLYEI